MISSFKEILQLIKEEKSSPDWKFNVIMSFLGFSVVAMYFVVPWFIEIIYLFFNKEYETSHPAWFVISFFGVLFFSYSCLKNYKNFKQYEEIR